MSSEPIPGALIAGATGLVGGFLLPLLLDEPSNRRVVALVRRPLALEHPKLTAARVYFDHLDANPALLAAADVYCCLGTTIRAAGSQAAFRAVDHGYVASLAQLSRDQGARRFFLVSVIGADPAARNFYLRVKGEAERAVERVGFDELHVFRPSFLVGPRPERRPLERLSIAFFSAAAPLLAGARRRYRPIAAATVAAAMAGAARAGLGRGRHVHDFDAMTALATGLAARGGAPSAQ